MPVLVASPFTLLLEGQQGKGPHVRLDDEHAGAFAN